MSDQSQLPNWWKTTLFVTAGIGILIFVGWLTDSGDEETKSMKNKKGGRAAKSQRSPRHQHEEDEQEFASESEQQSLQVLLSRAEIAKNQGQSWMVPFSWLTLYFQEITTKQKSITLQPWIYLRMNLKLDLTTCMSD
jgi:hypothetical protein